jgi:hypothetical protein
LYGSKNLKPLYDEEGSFFAGFWIEFKCPLAQANVKFEKCICYSIYACFAFCLFASSFFGDNIIALFYPFVATNDVKTNTKGH